MTTSFAYARSSVALGTIVTGGLAYGLYATSRRNMAHFDSGEPQKAFSGGPAFLSLPLESSELVNHNTKRLRFKLPSSEHVSGLPLTSSLLTIAWPKGCWLPAARPYTPISSSDEPGHIDFLVKHYPSGKQSTHLHSLTPGESLLFAVPIKGPQWKPSSNQKHVTLIAGGAGITPIYQLAQGILNDPSDTTSMTLIFGVNSERDILLRDEFKNWEEKFPSRFKAVYTVSKPTEEQSPYREGYVDRKLLEEVVKDEGSKGGHVYLCGPPAMEGSLVGQRGKSGILNELGYRKDQIHRF